MYSGGEQLQQILLICCLSAVKGTTYRFVAATCGSECVGSIAHPQQSRGPSLTELLIRTGSAANSNVQDVTPGLDRAKERGF